MSESKADKAMPEKLKAEHSGILDWCVQGCLAWQRDGLGEPKGVEDATSEYRGEQDVLGSFLEEHTVSGSSMKTRCSQLYDRYRRCSESGNEDCLTMTAFGTAMKERGVEKKTSNGTWYLGIGLRDF
jgi:putative DNA primase/helicase